MSAQTKKPFAGAGELTLMKAHTEDIVHMLESAGWDDVFDSAELDELSYVMSAYRGYRGQPLWRQGDDGEHAWLVALGAVETIARNDGDRIVSVREAQTGDTVGEEALLEEGLRPAEATISSDAAILLLIERVEFDRLAFRRPRLALRVAVRVARQLSRRLRDATGQMTGLRAV